MTRRSTIFFSGMSLIRSSRLRGMFLEKSNTSGDSSSSV